MTQAFARRRAVVDGLLTTYLEAGDPDHPPLVLLHGGEFGASAELGFERVIGPLAERFHVIAPDQLGYGGSAKVVDFTEGRRMRIRHVARLCDQLGVREADFVGNSMGGLNLIIDAASAQPLLPVRRMVALCGGGEILRNPFASALFDYDGTFAGMRAIVGALFHDPAYPADDAYVRRRHEGSIAPGAWEAIAAARFRRPGAEAAGSPREEPDYARIAVPTLVVEGGEDKIKPRGWAAGIAAQIPGATAHVVVDAGHCPQIEQPEAVVRLVVDFLEGTA